MLKGFSLFSNVGIAESYLHNYVDMVVANELEPTRVKFYKEQIQPGRMLRLLSGRGCLAFLSASFFGTLFP